TADSHFRLPTVDTSREELEKTDFAAFQPLADLPMAMTAHVVFSALDPAQPATTSATIIRQVIRGGIGFQGLLMSDDVSMNALAGSIAERTRANAFMEDRKSTRLNSSHGSISYAVFCLKKKTNYNRNY